MSQKWHNVSDPACVGFLSFCNVCLYSFVFSVTDNQVTTQNLKLTPEGPFPVYHVDLRKVVGSGMCYIQAGALVMITRPLKSRRDRDVFL